MLFFPWSIYIFCNFSLDLKRHRQGEEKIGKFEIGIDHMLLDSFIASMEKPTVMFYPLSPAAA